jgi:hypothetical protein
MDDVRRERLERARLSRPHDYFYGVPDYTDTLPDYSRWAREVMERVASSEPLNVLTYSGRAFWKLTDADSGELAWLAFNRPRARSPLIRRKVWTLIPKLQEFITNWFVSIDHHLVDQNRWIHTYINVNWHCWYRSQLPRI